MKEEDWDKRVGWGGRWKDRKSKREGGRGEKAQEKERGRHRKGRGAGGGGGGR